MTSPGPHSGLIVEIPEAEPVVRQHRERLDINAGLGVPAHITVLFPFMPPEKIDATVLTQLQRLFAAIPGFGVRLDHTGWFSDAVLWLAPHDPSPFQTLTRRVMEIFPAFPPYEGQFGDSAPHLTIGHGHPLSDLRAAEKSVQEQLPIESHATAVTLMTQQSAGGQWTKTATFALASPKTHAPG